MNLCRRFNLRGKFQHNRTATTRNLLPEYVVNTVTVNALKSRLDAHMASGNLTRFVCLNKGKRADKMYPYKLRSHRGACVIAINTIANTIKVKSSSGSSHVSFFILKFLVLK